MESFLQQSNNMLKVMKAIMKHKENGKSLFLHKWMMIRRYDFTFKKEGLLISSVRNEEIHVKLCGSYECCCCGIDTDFAGEFFYVMEDQDMFICGECMDTQIELEGENVVWFNITFPAEVVVDNGSPHIEFIDEREKTIAEKREIHMKILQTYADMFGYVFINGMDMKQIKEYLLTRRAIRMWKNLVEKRRTVAMFRVLYEKMHDINASMYLAKKVMMPKSK